MTALVDDYLNEEDWAQLAAVVEALGPFEYITQRLQGNSIAGSHGAVWEAITSLDYLLQHVEEKRAALREQRVNAGAGGAGNRRQNITPLEVAYQNAWEKLTKYNNLTDENHEIYAAATLLNPCLRKGYFEERWT